jgi:hypothetical protein
MKAKSKESYMDVAIKAIEGATKSSDQTAEKAADSAIKKINEISKQIASGNITPQQAEDQTRNIVIAVSEIPGLSQSSINALRKAAEKEDAIAEAKKVTNETSPGPINNNMANSLARKEKEPEKSKLSDLIQRIKDLANKMMSRFTVVTTESPELGRLHPESTPGKTGTRTKGKG